MAKKFVVGDDLYRSIDRKMCEIKRELNQKNESPLNPEFISKILQRIIDMNKFIFLQSIQLNLSEGIKKIRTKLSDKAKEVLYSQDFVSNSLNPSISKKVQKMDLYMAPTYKIIGRGATLAEIFYAIEEAGGKILPIKAVVEIMLQLKGRQVWERRKYVVTQPQLIDDIFYLFYIENKDNNLFLDVTPIFHNYIFDVNSIFICAM